MAICLFICWLLAWVDTTAVPVGIWMARTPVSTLFKMCIRDRVIGHALHLEILLGLLKEILSLGPVRDSSIPVVLCVSRCEEARRQGICIDSVSYTHLELP